MPDRKPTLTDRIVTDLATVRWPEPAEIRAEARRRTRRQVAGAAAVLLLVVGTSAVVFGPAARPGPHRVDASVAGPSPHVEIPMEALLQPADLNQRSDPPLTQAGLGELVQVDTGALAACRQAQGLPVGWETSLWSRSQTMPRNRPDGYDVLVSQDVYRVEPQVAVRFFATLDGLVASCTNWRSVGPIRWQGEMVTRSLVHSYALIDRNFTGDESALLRHTISERRNEATGEPLGEPSSIDLAVVRVGDLVTVINPDPATTTQDELRRLGRTAAARLCVAANPVRYVIRPAGQTAPLTAC
ncbi:hypothetical protein [Micromonospora cathayae]|uniref:Uncharacterized protein n=1 Tax=Micromonospora cathayae TaxID=3028804 RepID=A0ABY7ZV30_9ACTN|nr:hypothetical protein [Micromonospora sp. HUAS 3]WDZ86830.1 hypothetical protein PVK37_10745 [Micromonospora sp. HUAS 3]